MVQDPTTIAERADYAVYSCNQKLILQKLIFGDNCFVGSGGTLVEAAYEVADHFLNSGVTVHYAGSSVLEATNNGRYCIFNDIQGAWDKPIQDQADMVLICATYVSLAIWKAGLLDEATINQYAYNGLFRSKKHARKQFLCKPMAKE